MGLVHLLSVSKAFHAALDQPHRYRAAPRRALPRFESLPPSQSHEVPMKTEQSVGRVEATCETQVGPNKPQPERAIGLGQMPAKPRPTALARLLAGGRRLFSRERWGLRRPSGLAEPENAPREAVQQELRLENVKVCRNDLSDSDWEIVRPPKSGARLAFLRNLASTAKPAAKQNRAPTRETVAG